MARLRGGTAESGIEVERWHGVRREDRVCKECGNGEVENIDHFLIRCDYIYIAEERVRMERFYEYIALWKAGMCCV